MVDFRIEKYFDKILNNLEIFGALYIFFFPIFVAMFFFNYTNPSKTILYLIAIALFVIIEMTVFEWATKSKEKVDVECIIGYKFLGLATSLHFVFSFIGWFYIFKALIWVIVSLLKEFISKFSTFLPYLIGIIIGIVILIIYIYVNYGIVKNLRKEKDKKIDERKAKRAKMKRLLYNERKKKEIKRGVKKK